MGPFDEAGVNASLKDKVLHQTAHRIVGKGGHDCGSETETTAHAAGHIVLSASLPDVETARRVDTPFARIKAEHDFSET